MIGLHPKLSSISRMVYPWLLSCLVALVILLPGFSVWANNRANDRSDDRDEDESEFIGVAIRSAAGGFDGGDHDGNGQEQQEDGEHDFPGANLNGQCGKELVYRLFNVSKNSNS